MNLPMTLCVSFLRVTGPDSSSCCSSMWPLEGGVQVSQEQQFHQLTRVCSGAEGVELGWMLKSWPRGGVMEMQSSHTLHLHEL